AHAVPVMSGEQTAERPRDGVVSVLLPGPKRVKAAQRAIGRGTDGVLGRFDESRRAGACLRLPQGFGAVGFDQDHPPAVAPEPSGAPVGALPLDATAP